jgi:hypothetical protein
MRPQYLIAQKYHISNTYLIRSPILLFHQSPVEHGSLARINVDDLTRSICTGESEPIPEGVHLSTVLSLCSKVHPNGGCGVLHRERKGFGALAWSRTARSV